MDKHPGLSILCVEDDPDTAEVLAELLRREGYDVATAADSGQALERLKAGRYHLVICDYMLPDKTGTTLLLEAREAGLLDGSQLLLFTAHPDPERFDGLEVLRKPLAVDAFLRKVYEVLGPTRDVEIEAAKKRLAGGSPEAPAPGAARIDLVLYISSSSPASMRALRNMDELLAGYVKSQVRFTVLDISKEWSPSVEEDRIVFTPTLVQHAPSPRTWVLGDLQDIRVVTDLLLTAGVEKKQ